MMRDRETMPNDDEPPPARIRPATAHAFLDRLSAFVRLDAVDEERLRHACLQVRTYRKGHDLIREGDRPGPVFVILEGWACRLKILQNGNRQIIAFMMPGDFCDMHIGVLDEMDNNIETLTTATVATIQRVEMEALVEASPSLTRVFWWTQLVEAAMLRATIVSLGRRNSLERVAHLLCELCFRLQNVNRSDVDRYVMPFSQIVLADAVGLTPVHVNRVLRKLRQEGALELGGASMRIIDLAKLSSMAGFDDNYLHRRLGFSKGS
jgi:CRP-like cAMP-binding protein